MPALSQSDSQLVDELIDVVLTRFADGKMAQPEAREHLKKLVDFAASYSGTVGALAEHELIELLKG